MSRAERSARDSILVRCGKLVEASASLQAFLTGFATENRLEDAPLATLTSFLEAATALKDADASAVLAQATASAAPLTTPITCVARHLGAASALLGEREQAMRYYEQALEVCGRLRFRPEMALTHLGIAELLLDDALSSPASPIAGAGETPALPGRADPTDPARAEAMRHLDLAIAELREMKMQPALERALRHKDVLKA